MHDVVAYILIAVSIASLVKVAVSISRFVTTFQAHLAERAQFCKNKPAGHCASGLNGASPAGQNDFLLMVLPM